MSDRILEINDLSVAFRGQEAVHRISFHIDRGETVALVGESGSGKSVTALSVMLLLPYQYASHPNGSIKVDGREVVGLDEEEMLKIRGDRIGMVFQDPMTSLNPLNHIEKQIERADRVSKSSDQIEFTRSAHSICSLDLLLDLVDHNEKQIEKQIE